MGFTNRKKTIVALHREGATLEITKIEDGSFSSEKFEGEKAAQKLLIDQVVRGAVVVTGLGGSELLFRTLEIPLRSKQAILKALPFQLENLLPYSPDEAVVLPLVRPKNRKVSRVEIFSAQKKGLDTHLDFWRSLLAEPEIVSANIQGLFRFVQKFGKKETTLLHLGEKESYLLLVKGGVLKGAISLAFGCRSDRSQIKRELFRALHFFDEEIAPILLTGRECEGIGELIEELLEQKVIWISAEAIQNEVPFALTIGLALDAARVNKDALQFRSGSFAPRAQVVTLKRKATIFSAFFVAYLLIFSFTAKKVINHKEQVIITRFDSLALRCQKEFGVSKKVLGGGSFEERLDQLSKVLARVKGGSSLENPAPLVSDLLVYLAEHPRLQEGIEIKKVVYELTSYPNVDNPKKRYEAKVELEICADSSEIANQFYDHLRNEKKKVRWIRHEKGYKVSFIYS